MESLEVMIQCNAVQCQTHHHQGARPKMRWIERDTQNTPQRSTHTPPQTLRLNLYFRIRKWYYRSKADSIYLLEYILINTVYTINLGRAVDFFGVLILIRPYSIQHVCRVPTRDIFWWSPIPASHIHWHLRRSVYSDDWRRANIQKCQWSIDLDGI